MSEIIKKKRGRKPKNFINPITKVDINMTEESVHTEEEKIIFHLPITVDEINNNDNNDNSLFIKSEKDIKNINSNSNSKLNLQKNKSSEESDSTETLKSSSLNVTANKFLLNNNVNKITTHSLKFNKNTKCWWCRNSFSSPPCELPEDYFNETFYCTGHFCSFNCTKSYNLDLNDSLSWKRESLMNLLFYLTYSSQKQISPAPHWMTLEEYGGTLSIEQFRENSITNTKEYIVLHPPLISRQMQIEESYKLNKLKEVPIDKLNKIYSEIDSDYVIKRSKPIQSSQLNLETTMGLIKKKKSKK
jgi:hypothetical protein